MALATGCMEVILRNISGEARFFGCLPPHGRELAAFESISFFWDVFAGRRHKRKLDALKRAIQKGLLEIVQTPNPVLLDVVTGVTRRIQLSNSNLDLDEPCWESSES